MADEKVFLEEGNVKVTNTRVVIGSKTYAMAGVTAVGTYSARKNFPLAFTLIGVGAGLTGVGRGLPSFLQIMMRILTVGSIIVGVVILAGFSTTYGLTLFSASGENNIPFPAKKEFIEKVKEAINQSIIERQ